MECTFRNSYPQVYPQIDLTDIFNIWFGWREVEDSGLLSTFIDGVVMSWNFKGACQTSHIKPYKPYPNLTSGMDHIIQTSICQTFIA